MKPVTVPGPPLPGLPASVPRRRGEPRGGGDRGPASRALRGVSIPLGAGGRGASCCSSFFNNHRAALKRARKTQGNQSIRRRLRAAAPGRRRGDLGERRRPLPGEAVLRNSWKRNAQWTCWDPTYGRVPAVAPSGRLPALPHSSGLPPGEPLHPSSLSLCPSTATGKNSLPTRLRLQASFPGPRRVVRGGAARQAQAPGRVSKGSPAPEGAVLKDLAPKEAGLEFRSVFN